MPAQQSGRPTVEELQASVSALFAAQRRLTWRARRTGGPMSPERLRALTVLLAEGETTHSAIVKQAQLTQGSVSTMLDQLEAKGLVQRRRDDADGRVWWVSLTSRGRALAERHLAAWVETLSDAFDDLGDGQLRDAQLVLDRLTEVFDSIALD